MSANKNIGYLKSYHNISTVGELIEILQKFNAMWPIEIDEEHINVVYVKAGTSKIDDYPCVQINSLY